MSHPSSSDESTTPVSQVPRGGVVAMTCILSALALLSLYSNAQKWRRDKIETVTVIPAASATPTTAASSAP